MIDFSSHDEIDLNLPPKIESKHKQAAYEVFNKYYMFYPRPLHPNIDFSMNISLIHYQPFYFKLTRLSLNL